MVKNLAVNNFSAKKLKKTHIHKIIGYLKNELLFEISSIIINFISAAQIKKINKTHLNHDFSTDIITFNYSGRRDKLDGEIFISIEDAEFNAKKYGVNFEEEILRLIIHGILHLIGYDDKKLKEKQLMKRMENKLVKQYRLLIN